jgi:hypothetical protein
VTLEELQSGYQIRKASDAKMREAAMMRKQAEEVLTKLSDKNQLFDVIRELGHDPRGLSEEYLLQILEEEMMDPRDRELSQLKREKAQRDADREKYEKAEKEALHSAKVEKYTQDYSSQIVSALSESGLPKTESTVKRMAYYLHQGVKRGIEVTAADVVSLVKEDYINEQKQLFSNLDAENLIKLLGDDMAGKIRKYDLNRVKSNKNELVTPSVQPVKADREVKSTKISKEDWKAKLDRIKKGLE